MNNSFTQHLTDHSFKLAENPIWSPQHGGTFFIDISNCRIHFNKYQTTDLTTWQLTETVGCMALSNDGNAILGLRSGIYHFNLTTEILTFIAHPLSSYDSTVRYNDGKVSPEGDFWFASMDESSDRRPIASLFCLTSTGECHTIKTGLRVGNGIAFDEGRNRVYFSDTRAPAIYFGDYHDVLMHSLDKKEYQFSTLYNPKDDIGRPDGATVDNLGNYWSAGVSAGNLNKFSPDGDLLSSSAMPCNNPTMPCFIGPKLDRILVTSLKNSGSTNENDGKLFTANSSQTGKENFLFNLSFTL